MDRFNLEDDIIYLLRKRYIRPNNAIVFLISKFIADVEAVQTDPAFTAKDKDND